MNECIVKYGKEGEKCSRNDNYFGNLEIGKETQGTM